MVSVGVVHARGTPNTVNPCSRNCAINNLIFASNRVPMSPTANTITRNVTTRTSRDYHGINTVLRTTNINFSGIIGAAYFLTSVTSFTTFGRICTQCFASGPTHDYITIGSLPGNILYRVRTVTRTWTTFSTREKTIYAPFQIQATPFIYLQFRFFVLIGFPDQEG